MGCIGSRTIAAEAVPVDWKDSRDLDNVNLDSTNSLQGSNTQQSSTELSMEDTTSILPSLKRNSNPYGVGALAKSSLSVRLHSGLSKTVKNHITKPTAMGSGRVAHMIEWQGWSKQLPAPNINAEIPMDVDTYSDLSDGEKEARFAAGVMKQFAISEATLIAWSSMDGEEISNISSPGEGGQLNGRLDSTDQQDSCLQLFQESWPQLVTQGMYCLSTSGVWEPSPSENSPATLSSGIQHLEDQELQFSVSAGQLPPSVPPQQADAPSLVAAHCPPAEVLPTPRPPATSPSLGQDPESISPRDQAELPPGRKVSDVTSSGVQSFEDEEGE
ncbi:protein FAM131B-like isoform X2 [Scyliorhinus torazame]|uniref:protein FAM131B-like isoform X2 n=1 Tax=Scyliorhinus torazame TaxID=75743 RepID=UPI003B5A05DD